MAPRRAAALAAPGRVADRAGGLRRRGHAHGGRGRRRAAGGRHGGHFSQPRPPRGAAGPTRSSRARPLARRGGRALPGLPAVRPAPAPPPQPGPPRRAPQPQPPRAQAGVWPARAAGWLLRRLAARAQGRLRRRAAEPPGLARPGAVRAARAAPRLEPRGKARGWRRACPGSRARARRRVYLGGALTAGEPGGRAWWAPHALLEYLRGAYCSTLAVELDHLTSLCGLGATWAPTYPTLPVQAQGYARIVAGPSGRGR